MSARQPFFAGSRPPSRVAHLADQPTGAIAHIEQQPDSLAPSSILEPNALNLSQFRSSNTMTQKRSRGSFGLGTVAGQLAARPPTPAENENHLRVLNERKIASPHPSKASAFLPAAALAFKVPDVPVNKTVTPHPRPARTSPQNLDASFSPPAQTTAANCDTSGNSLIQDNHIYTMNPAQVFGEIDHGGIKSRDVEDFLSQENAMIEYPFGAQGPRRLLADAGPELQTLADGRILRRSRRSKTLSEEDFGAEGRGNAAKRSKLDTMDIRSNGATAHLSMQQHEQVQDIPTMEAQDARASHRPSRSSRNRSSLSSFLAFDVESFIAANEQRYLAMVRKWSHCSLEEWQAGEKEILDEFCGAIDLVKDHVAEKIKCLAQIDTRIAEHTDFLSHRDKLIAEVKADLIQNGGAVIGGNEGKPEDSG